MKQPVEQDPGGLAIEVVYALPERQTVISLNVSPGTTCLDAVRQSNITDIHPDIDLTALTLGVYGESVDVACEVRAGDRVEIYRPVAIDAKTQRRNRAAAARTKGPTT